MKNILFTLIAVSLIFASCKKDKNEQEETPLPMAEGTVKIAKWQGNKRAAMMFYFDDSTIGQAKYGVRIFNKHKLIGTWFVNPGSDYYKYNKEIWEKESQEGHQELANHTMTHKGAANNQKAEYEIGEASKIIWKARGEKEFTSLIAFNRGGGTSWDNISLKEILKKYKNIDRVTTKIGERMIGWSVPKGSNAATMLKNYPKALQDSMIWMLSFHGIAEKNGNPPMDHGNGAVWVEHFKTFAKKVEKLKADFWNAGYIQIYKYIQERKTANVNLLQYSNNKYAVELKSEKDAKYYNEPLTVIVQLPKDWTSCSVEQKGAKLPHTIKQGRIQFDAIPNGEKIYIRR